MLAIRYPPYDGKLKQYKMMNESKPNFDREGRVTRNWLTWVFRLGSPSIGGALKRYLFLILGIFGSAVVMMI